MKNGIRFHCETVPLSQTDTYHAGFFAQTYHLTKRALWNHTVHPGFYWVKLAVYILLDFVIASIYNRSQSIPDVHVAGLLYFVQSILVLLTIAGKRYQKLSCKFTTNEPQMNKSQFLLDSTFA